MEYSSPLAALRPQPPPSWQSGKDLLVPRSMYQTCGPTSFDFKTMSMNSSKPPRPDYFSARSLRGSSPTSSLMADLDANFHIDRSPQAPTPRRSLFTAGLFERQGDAGRLMTPPIEVEPTTPSIPLSSPPVDSMDISPLPHKAPFLQFTLPSPTPEGTPVLDEVLSPDLLSPETLPVLQPQTQPLSLVVPERRRTVSRPSLFRGKAHSAGSIPQRPTTAETQLPPFRFGHVAAAPFSRSSTSGMLESITQSPIEGASPAPLPQMAPPSRRPSIGAANRAAGSPSAGHIRKPSAGRPSFVRPARKLMRRSLSMFQHPDDVMREEQDSFEPQPCLSASMDIDSEHVLKLPNFIPESEPDSLPRITQETMLEVLEGKHSGKFDNVVIVDCRFEYEYQGGHIDGAVNFNDKQQLATELFETRQPSISSNTLLLLHCEYSVHRAPLTAKFIRNHDRNVNAIHYPKLTYPELYILDGGYSKFFHAHPSKCFPQNYVEMNDHRHELACERGMAKVKQRQKLFRHQTFAFGQNASPGSGLEDMDSSPTMQGRGSAGPGALGQRSQSSFAVGQDIADGIGQSFARRMASY